MKYLELLTTAEKQQKIPAGIATFFAILIMVMAFQNCSGSLATNSGDSTSYSSTSSYEDPFMLTISNTTVLEGNTLAVTLKLSTIYNTSKTFQYQTVDGTAYAGYNYLATSSSITFAAGENSKTIYVTTYNDGYATGDLYFYLQFAQFDTSTNYRTVTISFYDANSSSGSQLAGGFYHSCANVSGALYCWGYNNYGQLGDGGTSTAKTPQAVTGLEDNVTAVSAGAYHSCALRNSILKCWGLNTNGQLGDSTTTTRYAAKNVTSMTSGVSAVSAGAYFTCAIKSGALYCWGNNTYGQLGISSTASKSTPTAVSGMDSQVTQIATGNSHACAIKDSALYCWGYNYYGQLGEGSTTTQITPQAVSGMEEGVTSVAAGFDFTCAIQNSKVKCWGNNARGQLGLSNGNTTSKISPVANGITNGREIYANLQSACVLTSNSDLYCWGYNGYGQTGTSDTVAILTTPSVVLSPNATAASRGHGYHACGVSNSGISCWGYNGYGQLGTGSTTNSNSPQLVNF